MVAWREHNLDERLDCRKGSLTGKYLAYSPVVLKVFLKGLKTVDLLELV